MARKASSKPDSGSPSTASAGFVLGFDAFDTRNSSFGISFPLPAQLFGSTQIPVCLSFPWKHTPAGNSRAAPELEPAIGA